MSDTEPGPGTSRVSFGVCLSHGWRGDLPTTDPHGQWEFVLRQAQRAEALGFDSVWLMDHLQPSTQPDLPLLECWTTTAALAATTTRIRLGQMVTCNSYRPPALLAKMAACVDAIADGRLELGIGAGWFRPEYDTWGFDYPSTSVRLDMLEEAVNVIRAIWTESPVHFLGRYYKLDGVDMAPKPVQRPHPPIWIGSSGERKGLRIVAALADGWNTAGSVQHFADKHAVLRSHCDAIGRDTAEITTSWKGDVVCGATERDVEQMLGPALESWQARGFAEYGSAETYRRDHLVGTPAQIIERIAAYRAAGCQYFVCDLFDTDEGLDRLAEDVLPQL